MILAAILAMGLTSCKNNADPDALLRKWTSNAMMNSWTLSSSNTRLSSSGYTFNYTSDNDLNTITYPDKPDTFNFATWAVTQENTFTGFKATASTTPAGSPYGFSFFIDINNQKWTYYTLIIAGNAIKVSYTPYTGDSTTIINWKEDDAINASGQNEVVVYTDKDSSIIININGKTVGIIRSPVLKVGYCGIIGAVTYDSYTSNTKIKSTYTFKEFQY